MVTPKVTELPLILEPVTDDPFAGPGRTPAPSSELARESEPGRIRDRPEHR